MPTMSPSAQFLRASRVIASSARYFGASRSMLWTSPAAVWRYFWSAHRPSMDQDKTFHMRSNGFNLAVRPKDWCAFEEVLVRDEYGFVNAILEGNPCPRVLDLGANIGLFGVRVLRVRPRAHIFALEPSLATFRVLQANCAANPGYAWHALRYAAWDSDGTARFNETRYSTGSHVSQAGDAIVPTITLSRLMRQYTGPALDLVKMDIEGAELAVLARHELLLEHVQHLILEIHPNRCSVAEVLAVVRRRFAYLHEVPDRVSEKPLIVASRRRLPLPLLRQEAA